MLHQHSGDMFSHRTFKIVPQKLGHRVVYFVGPLHRNDTSTTAPLPTPRRGRLESKHGLVSITGKKILRSISFRENGGLEVLLAESDSVTPIHAVQRDAKMLDALQER